ncbi:hypothetical protein GCM10023091_07040 [Ravibacter arvi]|uniref:Lipoprotein n=1 Tax=Ravibacter arvi TaxID=2051041 RepID=A0ABP8LQK0_9BACT
MKKILAFAIAATMVSFAACTSKPSETEVVEETTETVVEPVAPEADTTATDTAAPADTTAAPAPAK